MVFRQWLTGCVRSATRSVSNYHGCLRIALYCKESIEGFKELFCEGDGKRLKARVIGNHIGIPSSRIEEPNRPQNTRVSDSVIPHILSSERNSETFFACPRESCKLQREWVTTYSDIDL